ncbi:AGC family serine/threonine kinase, putative [Trypanosoma equiperdum]|uniref:Serine/threonine-protein kinase, putative n=4 Tax=Trypanozoon TaxID=39700 RepID=Q582V7_TRYB2|nr:protein kinase, putative [Trypanosoma brucei gambiense DAL972]XP_843838.1 serine/threonine-protein kinase, putative [Trypanosoma brucei brucei TREU927]AAX80732.1 serine/threonine-protein kinase, putative [Trypanosoma brucei]RHW73933.1 AGC family serine/threonine kinase [Trypanosoma brucei equiperdum]SCU70628.1 AGC family serine/threonine kinase, putative [Trypanosoma equiperdum]AAZ10279.1 serine/threonine-protein kinase, putative [Trypanosoma brucei brucei TREU927]CBH09905.1 protein kinase|eukprot:XP_011772198.1 protein kinase, putative [Trypanosoma brucei gambiense DAL972]
MLNRLFGRGKSKKDKDKDKDKSKEKEKRDGESSNTKSGNSHKSGSERKDENTTEKVTKEDFETIDTLGKGSFAYVVLVRRVGTNNLYAMKVVNKQGLLDHNRCRDVFIERNVLSRINHPFLLKLYWTFQSEHKLFFVMEYMAGGDLDKYMNSVPNKQLDLPTSKLYGAEILMAILTLHEQSVIYRDLKPENILLTGDGHCVLADFGLSKDFYDAKMGENASVTDMRANSFVGSPFYVAPDVLKQREYTNAVDFWSFGILLYRMLCGRTPFSGKNMKEVFDNILYSDLRFPSTVSIPSEAKDLISRLLVKDAAHRIKGPEVKAHPFWTGINFDEVMQKKVKPPRWVPAPSVDKLIAERSAAQSGNNSSKNPAQVVNTPAHSSQLNARQQQLFNGFSCTTDNHLGGGS